MLHHRRSSAFSLVELLIVIALMGILAGLALPDASSSIHQQLETAAQIVATDLDYGRSLAVSNASTYRFTFDNTKSEYILRHAGTSRPDLHTLPTSAFRTASDSPDRQTFRLADIPRIGPPVLLLGVQSTGNQVQNVTTLEFDQIGATTRAEPTCVWLTSGVAAAQRYISVTVDPATGLTTIGELKAVPPTGVTN